jgi:hypothetical protein
MYLSQKERPSNFHKYLRAARKPEDPQGTRYKNGPARASIYFFFRVVGFGFNVLAFSTDCPNNATKAASSSSIASGTGT